MAKKTPSLAVGRGEKLPVSKGAGLTEKGRKKYRALLKKGENHGIEKTGTRLRSLMPWIKKRNLKGAQASYA